jgi:hypothetical protein
MAEAKIICFHRPDATSSIAFVYFTTQSIAVASVTLVSVNDRGFASGWRSLNTTSVNRRFFQHRFL